jgi:protein TonB
MRRTLLALSLLVFPSLASAQNPAGAQNAAPQTARQALIEMFFGTSANHLERHLADITRKSFQRMPSSEGQNLLMALSSLSMQVKSSGAKLETFDTGPSIVTVEDTTPSEGRAADLNRVEVTVERDDLIGDEDDIELALHLPQQARDEMLPITPHLTFAMKTEADIWKLTDITVTVRLPIADPDFLKGIEDSQKKKSEQMTMWEMRQVNTAEQTYSAQHGKFACSLAAMGPSAKQPSAPAYLYDPQLAAGNKNGYVFVISECDGLHYKVVAEPATPDSGQKAYCSDESGAVRASDDGKAITCLSSGETVLEATPESSVVMAAPQVSAAPAPAASSTGNKAAEHAAGNPGSPRGESQTSISAPQRVRVSSGVMQGMLISKVAPIYPEKAKAATVQGTVVLSAVIGKDGAVQNVKVVSSGSPLLDQAAIDAVKQWKYRPYILNGNAVEVDTTMTINFVLSGG